VQYENVSHTQSIRKNFDQWEVEGDYLIVFQTLSQTLQHVFITTIKKFTRHFLRNGIPYSLVSFLVSYLLNKYFYKSNLSCRMWDNVSLMILSDISKRGQSFLFKELIDYGLTVMWAQLRYCAIVVQDR